MNVLVTGAARGLGLEFCRQLLERQDVKTVVATVRDATKSVNLRELSEKNKERLHIVEASVTDDASLTALADAVRGVGVEKLDAVVNNAGVGLSGGVKIGDLNFEAFRESFEVNTIGPFRILQSLVSLHAENLKTLQLTSLMGSVADNTSGGSLAYRASKAALNAITKSYAIDHPKQNILSMHPGWVRTDMGGPNALIDVETSVKGMLGVFFSATREMSGGFYDYQGNQLPW